MIHLDLDHVRPNVSAELRKSLAEEATVPAPVARLQALLTLEGLPSTKRAEPPKMRLNS